MKRREPNASDNHSIQPLHPLCCLCRLPNEKLGMAGTQANHNMAEKKRAALAANEHIFIDMLTKDPTVNRGGLDIWKKLLVLNSISIFPDH